MQDDALVEFTREDGELWLIVDGAEYSNLTGGAGGMREVVKSWKEKE